MMPGPGNLSPRIVAIGLRNTIGQLGLWQAALQNGDALLIPQRDEARVGGTIPFLQEKDRLFQPAGGDLEGRTFSNPLIKDWAGSR